MFYSKDMIKNDFDLLINKLEQQELFLSEPMLSYKTDERWTDEMRIRDGNTKLADGSWVTIHKVSTWVEKLKKGSTKLYDENQKAYREIALLKRQRNEMEYGLRVAMDSLKKSLALTKEMSDE